MMKEDETDFVIMTGMHRSGTSYLSRALNLCGVNLGPKSDFYDTELNPKFGNPRGHWENNKIVNLNEKILKTNDGTWWNVPKSIEKLPSNFDNKINTILKSFYSENAICYGFKDPRFCITLDSWSKNFPNFVLTGIFRHPLKVAESLKLRDGFDYDKSLNLWKVYNQNLLAFLKKFGGFLLDFDWPKKKLLEETQLITLKLDIASVDLSNWFSDSYKSSDKSYKKSYPLSDDIKKIYEELKQFSEQNSKVNYLPPKISPQKYKMIFSDMINNSNVIYMKTLEEFKKRSESENQKNLNILDAYPIVTLISIYNQRKDLQKKFPEVKQGNFDNIIKWANQISSSEIEGELVTKKQLSNHSNWFENYLLTIL